MKLKSTLTMALQWIKSKLNRIALSYNIVTSNSGRSRFFPVKLGATCDWTVPENKHDIATAWI